MTQGPRCLRRLWREQRCAVTPQTSSIASHLGHGDAAAWSLAPARLSERELFGAGAHPSFVGKHLAGSGLPQPPLTTPWSITEWRHLLPLHSPGLAEGREGKGSQCDGRKPLGSFPAAVIKQVKFMPMQGASVRPGCPATLAVLPQLQTGPGGHG